MGPRKTQVALAIGVGCLLCGLLFAVVSHPRQDSVSTPTSRKEGAKEGPGLGTAVSGTTSGSASPPASETSGSRSDAESLAERNDGLPAGRDPADLSSIALRLRFYWADANRPAPGLSVELRRFHGREGEIRTGETDAQGVCAIEYPSEWTEGAVSAWGRRAYAGPVRMALPANREVDIQVRGAFSAHGHVLLRDEKTGVFLPVEGAEVCAASDFPQRVLTTRDGSWRLDQISRRNTFFAATYGNLRAFLRSVRGDPVFLVAGRDNGPFDLVLTAQEGCGISGAVLRCDNLEAIPYAQIGIGTYGMQTVGDESGLYAFESLPPGEIEIQAGVKGFSEAKHRVELTAGEDATVIFHLHTEARIEARVADRVGAPIEGAALCLSSPGTEIEPVGETDAEGKASLTGLDSTVVYDVSAQSRGRTSNFETVRFPPGRPEVEVLLTMPFDLSDEEAKGLQEVYAGTVSDLGGWPIGGATVAFRRYSEVEAGLRNARRKTTTGDNGRYRIAFEEPTGYGQGGYEASAVAEGYATQWQWVDEGRTPDKRARVDFELGPERTVRGLAVDSDDVPIAGVKVEAWPEEGYDRFFPGQPETFTRSDGKFWIRGLAGPKVRVFLTKPGWSAILGQVVRTDEEETRFVMRPGASIRGIVVDAATQQPIPDFTVCVLGPGIGAKEAQSPERFFSEDGKFAVGGLTDAASYDVEVKSPRYAPSLKTGLAAAIGKGEETVFSLTRVGQATGVVVDAVTGAPVSDAMVFCNRMPGLSSSDWIQAFWTETGLDEPYQNWELAVSTLTDAEGLFSVEGRIGEAALLVRSGNYAPVAIAPGFASRYVDPGSGSLRVPLERGISLAVSMVLEGIPCPHHRLAVTSLSERDRISHHFMRSNTDASGLAAVNRVPTGVLVVACYAPEGEARTAYALRSKRVLALEGGALTVNLGSSPGAGALSGVVRRGDRRLAGATVLASGDSSTGFVASAVTDSVGRYRMAGLPPGPYSIELREPPDYDSLPLVNPVASVSGETRHDLAVSEEASVP